MGKYGVLADHLRHAASPVSMTFDEIDDLVGGLPASARRHRAWWANEADGRHVQARAWVQAGWRVEDVSLTQERVRFSRGSRTSG